MYRQAFRVANQHVFPFVFGMLALGMVTLGVAGTLNRAAFTAANAAGRICRPDSATLASLQRVSATTIREFDNRHPCTFTGIELERGVPYRATVRIGAMDNGVQGDRRVERQGSARQHSHLIISECWR